MASIEQSERIGAIVDTLMGNQAAQTTILDAFSPRIDISRPNIHDTKREFLFEVGAIEGVANHLSGVIDLLVGTDENESDEAKAMIARLSGAIEFAAYQRNRTVKIDQPSDLALKNIRDTGFFHNSMRVVIEMYLAYSQRLVELRDQEKQFWSVSNRAPNYYARTIALRLARLYAKEKGKRPTFGIASAGNHPSTDFGRALEQIFEVLNIKASVRNAAQWALDQLNDDDLRPKQNVMSGLYKFDAPTRSPVVDALKKGT